MSEPSLVRRINTYAANAALDLEPVDRIKQAEANRVITVTLCELAQSMLDDQQEYVRDLLRKNEDVTSHA